MDRLLWLSGLLLALALPSRTPLGVQAPVPGSPVPGATEPDGMTRLCCRKPYAKPPAAPGGCMTLCIEVPAGSSIDCNTDLVTWSSVVPGACVPGVGACSAGGTQPITVFQYRCLGPTPCTVQGSSQAGQRCTWFATGYTRRVDAPTCTGILCPS